MMRATTPLQIKGNNAIVTKEMPILMMAKMPVHQQLQQCHHHEGNTHNGDNGKDICALTVTTPSQ
jgi:hypothetical protein